jgi:hypothetical protein
MPLVIFFKISTKSSEVKLGIKNDFFRLLYSHTTFADQKEFDQSDCNNSLKNSSNQISQRIPKFDVVYISTHIWLLQHWQRKNNVA